MGGELITAGGCGGFVRVCGGFLGGTGEGGSSFSSTSSAVRCTYLTILCCT